MSFPVARFVVGRFTDPTAMGSLPDGTLCAYCGIREAGYIPDGCCGPVCMDYCILLDIEQLVSMRLSRLWCMYSAAFAKTIGRWGAVLAHAQLSEHVASFLWNA